MSAAWGGTPIWSIRSGFFVGWRTADDQFYGGDGTHLGYFVAAIAYSNEGHVIGELYGERRLGKREQMRYPTGTRQEAREAKPLPGLADATGLPLAGWTDPDL